MAFHSHDGWFWERGPNGSVRVFVQKPGEGVSAEHVLDSASWASIVSSVSKGDEVDGRFYSALAFHASTGPVTVTSGVSNTACVCCPPAKAP